jgi:hypothetical protein
LPKNLQSRTTFGKPAKGLTQKPLMRSAGRNPEVPPPRRTLFDTRTEYTALRCIPKSESSSFGPKHAVSPARNVMPYQNTVSVEGASLPRRPRLTNSLITMNISANSGYAIETFICPLPADGSIMKVLLKSVISLT